MSRHLKEDLEEAFHRVLALSGQVEEMIAKSLRALMERHEGLASEVIALDEQIDRVEVRIEEECLKMLALHQPVAADLRRLTTMMKVTNDLERIADLACNVAERTTDLIQYESFPIPSLLRDMSTAAIEMVRDSLNAFVNLDVELAYLVIHRDNRVDEMNCEVIQEITQLIQEDVRCVDAALYCFSASRCIEQIADHAVNVAEDVIYMVNGVIVRHRHNDPRLRPQV